MAKKKGLGIFEVGIAMVVIIAIALFLGVEMPESGVTTAPGELPSGAGILIDGDCQMKPYTVLNFSGSTYGANDFTAPAGEVKIFAANVDPGAANVNYIDKMQVTAGIGFTTNATLTSCTEYTIVYDGRDAEYDVMYSATQLPYVTTTESTISRAILNFGPESIVVASTIPDPIEEGTEGTDINGQTNTSGNASSGLLLEIEVGSDDTPADSDVIYYNDTNGDTSFYLDFTLGASGGNTRLMDPVVCFVNDISNPMEGTEFTKVTTQRQSGTDLHLDKVVTDYFTGFDCIPMWTVQEDGHNWINGGQQGEYRFTFTVDEGNTDVAGADVLYIWPDDCGEYLGKDIMNDQDKATAGAVVEIQFRDSA